MARLRDSLERDPDGRQHRVREARRRGRSRSRRHRSLGRSISRHRAPMGTRGDGWSSRRGHGRANPGQQRRAGPGPCPSTCGKGWRPACKFRQRPARGRCSSGETPSRATRAIPLSDAPAARRFPEPFPILVPFVPGFSGRLFVLRAAFPRPPDRLGHSSPRAPRGAAPPKDGGPCREGRRGDGLGQGRGACQREIILSSSRGADARAPYAHSELEGGAHGVHDSRTPCLGPDSSGRRRVRPTAEGLEVSTAQNSWEKAQFLELVEPKGAALVALGDLLARLGAILGLLGRLWGKPGP